MSLINPLMMILQYLLVGVCIMLDNNNGNSWWLVAAFSNLGCAIFWTVKTAQGY